MDAVHAASPSMTPAVKCNSLDQRTTYNGRAVRFRDPQRAKAFCARLARTLANFDGAHVMVRACRALLISWARPSDAMLLRYLGRPRRVNLRQTDEPFVEEMLRDFRLQANKPAERSSYQVGRASIVNVAAHERQSSRELAHGRSQRETYPKAKSYQVRGLRQDQRYRETILTVWFRMLSADAAHPSLSLD